PSSGNAPARSREGQATELSPIVRSIFDRMVTTAAAEEPDLTVSTPAIETLTKAMKARHPKLEPYYHSGAIGLTTDALIAIRDAAAIPLAERNLVRQLVAEENADRSALYREIARANERPEWEENIRATFASRWVANARSGWWYQDRGGTWRQK
ncbi:MAG: YdbL family protein, partial [Candidatus Binatia bacterium]|nr:YdbL family protein [Candidatus Binatia bacterium]